MMEEFKIRIDDLHLQAQKLGSICDEKPTLVFLHEGLGSIPQWKDFPKLLSEALGLSAFLYERRGYGRSSPSLTKRTSFYLHHEAEILEKVLKEARIRRPIFIGHSDGGTIALLYQSEEIRPEAIVTMAAHVFVEDITLRGIQRAIEAYQTTSLPEKLRKYHGDKTDTLFWAWADTWLSPEFRNWKIMKDITQVRCPVLILQGENDEYGTFEQCQEIQKSVSGPAQIQIVPNSAHSPHIEKKEAVVKIILNFLREGTTRA